MIKVLFICHGNICRSPMAEYIFKNIAVKEGKIRCFDVASAATSGEEIGSDIYSPAKDILKRHEIPFEKHHARQIKLTDFSYYDYIICMEQYNIQNLARRFGPEMISKVSLLMSYTENPRDVADPWYSGDFETAYDDIEQGCRTLFKTLIIKAESSNQARLNLIREG